MCSNGNYNAAKFNLFNKKILVFQIIDERMVFVFGGLANSLSVCAHACDGGKNDFVT